MRRRRLCVLPFAVLLLAACNVNVTVIEDGVTTTSAGGSPSTGGSPDTGGTGGAGAGGTTLTTSSISTSSTATLPSDECGGLHVEAPVLLPVSSGPLSKLRVQSDIAGAEIALTFLLQAPDQASHSLFLQRLDAFDVWPPALVDAEVALVEGVDDYEMGPGPDGPVIVGTVAGEFGSFVVTGLHPAPQIDPLPAKWGQTVLFAAGLPLVQLWAYSTLNDGNHDLTVASYQPGGQSVYEPPFECTQSPLRAAVVRAGNGFVTAYAVGPDPMECAAVPQPAGILRTDRYEGPGQLGEPVIHTEGYSHTLWAATPMAHLAMAPTSFGAWVAYQSETVLGENIASTLQAYQVGADGSLHGSPSPVDVGWVTYVTPGFAAASLGDRLALAWIDAIDPSAPVIMVQVVKPDGALGPAISISTNGAWYAGDLQLLASPSGDSLFVAWFAYGDTGAIGVARIDCLLQ